MEPQHYHTFPQKFKSLQLAKALATILSNKYNNISFFVRSAGNQVFILDISGLAPGNETIEGEYLNGAPVKQPTTNEG